jgi:hypothetical protein
MAALYSSMAESVHHRWAQRLMLERRPPAAMLWHLH